MAVWAMDHGKVEMMWVADHVNAAARHGNHRIADERTAASCAAETVAVAADDAGGCVLSQRRPNEANAEKQQIAQVAANRGDSQKKI
jgi:hypothetical protein